jgi:hypothetical protein
MPAGYSFGAEIPRFVAYSGEFMFFYNCNKHGFGVRKVMVSINERADGDLSALYSL